MCGIVGMWDKEFGEQDSLLETMQSALRHRGPDDLGRLHFPKSGVALAHTRLSVLDLSSAGHQPMKKGYTTIVFNGEIYNFKELRNTLLKQGHRFDSNSDTEVLLSAYQEWGFEMLHHLRGMFAFTIWDEYKEILFVARDRVGVKPLYYYVDNNRFIFGSEIRSLEPHPAIKKDIDFTALTSFLQFGYIPAPLTIYEEVKKLRPGTYMIVNKNMKVTQHSYWDPATLYTHQSDYSTIYNGSEKEILDELEDLVVEAFGLRQVSDVPVGIFLSGGIDSSLVTAVLQKQNSTPLQTFTVGFAEEKYNEASFARMVADHCNTDHHELLCSVSDAQEIVHKLPEIFDEPFADPSAIPTYLVSDYSKRNVKVVLSADGADELFCGYGRYNKTAHLFNSFSSVPKTLATLSDYLPERFLGSRKDLLTGLIKASGDLSSTYIHLRSRWTSRHVSELFVEPRMYKYDYAHQEAFKAIADNPLLTQLQYVDFKTYLPDDIMAKTDRSTMAVGLEGREPFLDHKLVEFAAQLPEKWKCNSQSQNKYILRKLLARYLPEEIVNRPKQGFSVPIESWLKNDLQSLIDEYLEPRRIEREGIFNHCVISREVNKFLAGKQGPGRVWNLLMFQMWKEKWKV